MMIGITLNEDDSHYFGARAGQTLDAEMVVYWVDQHAYTQVKELMLNPNCMHASFTREVWNPLWHGYDPDGPDDQPLLASLPPDTRAAERQCIHTAWQLAHDGIDIYAIWIARCRQCGIVPWLSMRMNDVHCVDARGVSVRSGPRTPRALGQAGVRSMPREVSRKP